MQLLWGFNLQINNIISPQGNRLVFNRSYKFNILADGQNLLYRLISNEFDSGFNISPEISYKPFTINSANKIRIYVKEGNTEVLVFEKDYIVEDKKPELVKNIQTNIHITNRPSVILLTDMSEQYLGNSIDAINYAFEHRNSLNLLAIGMAQNKNRPPPDGLMFKKSMFFNGITYTKDSLSFEPMPRNATPISNRIIRTAKKLAKAGEKLWIINTGILGDLAQAIYDAPEISNYINLFTIYPHEDRLYDSSAYFWIYNFLTEENPDMFWIDSGSLSRFPEAKPNTFIGTEENFARTGINHLISPKMSSKYKIENLTTPVVTSLAGRYKLASPELKNYYIDLSKKSNISQSTVPSFPR